MRIARPWAMPADINQDGSHSQGIFISPMLWYFRTVILLLSCLTFWPPHVSHSSYAFISNFTTPSSVFKTTVDCFSKGFLNNFPKVNVYSFSSHFAVVFIEYRYDRIIKYVKAIVLYVGWKGKCIDELNLKCAKVKCMLLIVEVFTHKLPSGFTFDMFNMWTFHMLSLNAVITFTFSLYGNT